MHTSNYRRPANSSAEINTSMSGDEVYYQQVANPLLHSFNRAMTFGELGSVDTGNFYLCRHEDRMMWIQVVIRFLVSGVLTYAFFYKTKYH